MIAWFAKNSVAVNFLLLSLLALGFFTTKNSIPLEVFPTVEIDKVNITVVQRASSPEDIEQGITNRIEEAVSDLEFIEELSSRSSEQSSQVTIELTAGTDRQEALNEIKTRVDAISTLPQGAERPVIELVHYKSLVLNLVVFGDISEKELVSITRKVRDDLARLDGITLVETTGIRPFEIAIEVSQASLRSYNLSLEDIAQAIKSQARDISGGQIRTNGGDILVRSKQQAFDYDDFNRIVLKRYPDGAVLKLADIATINDGFDENPIITSYNGQTAANISVFRVGNESAIAVSDTVKAYLEANHDLYPHTVKLEIWSDYSDIVKERLNTLLSSGWQGGLLIAILLTLFLHPTVAFWVVIGIPVCFAGALALFPTLGITLNLLSLFAFILVLGVVVDDAIVTGENIYTHRSRGSGPLQAAIEGTQEVSRPVIFGVITTMLAFVPLLLLPTSTRTLGLNLGGVVIPVLAFSLIESKLILPNHLSHLQLSNPKQTGFYKKLQGVQDWVNQGLAYVVNKLYQPLLRRAIKERYLAVVIFTCVLFIAFSLLSNGLIKSSFTPVINSNTATASITFPAGAPFDQTEHAVRIIEQAAFDLAAKHQAEKGSAIENILAVVGSSIAGRPSRSSAGASNIGTVKFNVDPDNMDELNIDIDQLISEWREAIGTIIGADKLVFSATLFGADAPIFVRLEGHNVDELTRVTEGIRSYLRGFEGIFDIEDSLQDGKRELRIELTPEAELLGLTVQSLTTQVRHALFGSEAQRIQRGVDDVRVMVRYPLHERETLAQLDNLLITTPQGGEARFGDLASIVWTRSPSNIYHQSQLRTISIQADINREKVDALTINGELEAFINETLQSYPDVTYSFDGEAKSRAEFLDSFKAGVIGILFAIFALLAIAFKSYYQPVILLSVIPFAMTGAVLGHGIVGVGWSMFSYFGIFALVGVVINDSLVLVDWINRRREEGEMTIHEIILAAGKARFRAIMLTSLTTFAGLLPILFNQSVGAAFLKPMAVSLGFGIVYATFITLILVPCNFMIWEDIKNLAQRLMGREAAD